MNILPKVKENKMLDGAIKISKINWIFCDGVDQRIIKAAHKIAANDNDGTKVYINSGSENDESYHIIINTDKIEIKANGARGAFYGLKTLEQLMKNNSGEINCCEIYDYPDMEYRGFYHDVTRGKIPTMETFKELVDTLAKYKINSLQLYVEHTFEFKEYEFCRERFGYLSKDEMRELDRYCTENFVELIPSLSTFGHLYELLQNEKYKHLCEKENHEPKDHYWIERMFHHTINPELEESFELVKSLIDQYIEVFTSDKFNICCDETFDLGNGVKHSTDKTSLYIGFANKIIAYLKSKGKKVMMWGDIILEHPERINELPSDIVFLNWDYGTKPPLHKCEAFKGKQQIVCPGTSSWASLSEAVGIEEENIGKLARNGYSTNAYGILNTNWGDYGNLCSLEMARYGLVCGAAIGWDKDTVFDSKFRKMVSGIEYGDEDIVELFAQFTTLDMRRAYIWYRQIYFHSDVVSGQKDKYKGTYGTDLTKKDYEDVMGKLKTIAEQIEKKSFHNEDMRKEMLIAVKGSAVMASWNALIEEVAVECFVDYEQWKKDYCEAWMKKNKRGELDEAIRLFDCCQKRYENKVN